MTTSWIKRPTNRWYSGRAALAIRRRGGTIDRGGKALTLIDGRGVAVGASEFTPIVHIGEKALNLSPDPYPRMLEYGSGADKEFKAPAFDDAYQGGRWPKGYMPNRVDRGVAMSVALKEK
jgi:hypothetical protein